ncbi:hypothetical protein KP509_20G006400 [Ceratopteris richardii]|uniref:Uncharacterized protein n=1 Tax=Ceratopteris richardii TaxID=49495 RepID=A0A8T2SEK0_CERRI|nr:hypothetical protein KP509_20G006400 [Ceratopteris richardii]
MSNAKEGKLVHVLTTAGLQARSSLSLSLSLSHGASCGWPGWMSPIANNSMRVFGPKMFDPNLARKILGCSYNQEDQKSSSSSEADCKQEDNNNRESNHEITSKSHQNPDIENEAEDMQQRDTQEYEFFNHMQEVLAQLSFERKQKDACLSKIKEIEISLQDFNHDFSNKIKELRQNTALNNGNKS